MKTEREKMLAGEMYNALDLELVLARERARAILKELGASSGADPQYRRRILEQLFGQATDAWIEPPFFCDYGTHISLGKSVFFNFNCVILDVAPVRIGNHVLFGPNVQVYTATHPLDAAQRRQGIEFGRAIEIGDDVWIGGGTIVCPGVTIGARAVIGAGSVVTKDIPPAVMAAGNPCRVIRPLTAEERPDSAN